MEKANFRMHCDANDTAASRIWTQLEAGKFECQLTFGFMNHRQRISFCRIPFVSISQISKILTDDLFLRYIKVRLSRGISSTGKGKGAEVLTPNCSNDFQLSSLAEISLLATASCHHEPSDIFDSDFEE